jgi:hypothetical protein
METMFGLDATEMYKNTGACCDLYDDKDLASSLERHGKFTAPPVKVHAAPHAYHCLRCCLVRLEPLTCK